MPEHDDLSPFTDGFSEGMHVNPLPASEVRRRGDRMRRRNTTFATVGGVVAAAVFVGLPVALMNAGDSDRGPAPAPPGETKTDDPTPPEWVTTVPDDFPLADGFPETNGDGSATEVVRDDPEADLEVPGYVELCALTWPSSTKPQDWATIDYSGESENTSSRALYLHDDAETADLVFDLLRKNVQACPDQATGGGDSVIESRLVDGDLGTEKTLVVAQQVVQDDGLVSQLTLTEVGLAGNAIYVTQSYGSAGGDDVVASETARLREQSAVPLAAMCAFSAEPCSAPTQPETTETSETPPPTTPIPADFPLGRGLDEPSSEVTITGPGEDVEGAPVLDVCGTDVFATSGVGHRLAVSESGIEYFESRELLTFITADEPIEALTTVRDAVRDCPTMESATQGYTTEILDGPDGDSFTWGYYADDGVPTGGVFQITRVGSAILVVYARGEMSASSLQPTADNLSKATLKLVPEMCIFTEDGC